MIMNNMKNKKGFTLIEILVTMSIFIVLVIMAGDYITTNLRATTFASEQEIAIDNARVALENITVDLREARRSERGDYPLVIVDSQDFTWYGDVDNDSQAEKIRYALVGSELIKIIVEPGPINDYSGAGATTTIARYVNNQTETIFTYFDSNNNETDVINTIRLVNIILKINVTPERAPADYVIDTDINLRNLKDNL